MRKRLSAAVFIALIFSSVPGALAAEHFKPSPWVTTRPYFQQASYKLGFGVLNLSSGWLSLIYEPLRGNFFSGFARGIWRTAAYTLGGAVHAVTFPIPVDLPLPEGGIQFRS